MKITNTQNLPEPILVAVSNETYTKGEAEYSVTELLSPPRQRALVKKHWDDIEEDASSRIWSLLGQSVHAILERANKTGIAERRLTVNIDGYTISGGMDLVHGEGVLDDYKITTAYKFLDGKVPTEYEQQLNMYAAILRENNLDVKELWITAILRDWSKMEAARNEGYPRTQVIRVPINVWPHSEAITFMRTRLSLHISSRYGELPECTSEEVWAKPTKYAVMTPKLTRAVKLYDSELDAATHASQDPSKLYVEKRPGDRIRCRLYCSVNKFCSQYQSYEKELTDAFQK